MSSIYDSPDSNLAQDKKRNVLIAVVIGIVVDFGLTMLVSIAFGVVSGVMFLRQGVPAAELESIFAESMPKIMDSFLGYVFTAFGLFASFLGGYISSRYANQKELLIATILSIVSIAVWFYSDTKYYSDVVSLALAIFGVLVIYLGAYAWIKQKI